MQFVVTVNRIAVVVGRTRKPTLDDTTTVKTNINSDREGHFRLTFVHPVYLCESRCLSSDLSIHSAVTYQCMAAYLSLVCYAVVLPEVFCEAKNAQIYFWIQACQ